MPDIAFQIVVFGSEMFIVGYSKLIVRFSQGKAKDEVRRIEVEHAVIEDGVDATRIVLVPYGSVPEKGIYFTSCGTGQQADAEGVCRLCSQSGGSQYKGCV